MSTFTEFKDRLYNRIDDITIFNCADISLFKVALDGLKVDYVGKGKVRPFALHSRFMFDLVVIGKKFRYQKTAPKVGSDFSANVSKEIIVTEVGRLVKGTDEGSKSFYFQNIMEAIGRENLVYVAENSSTNDLNFDFKISEIQKIVETRYLSSTENQFRTQVRATYKKIKRSRLFSAHELKNIKFAFHKFFMEYRAWDYFLSNLPNLKRAYFVCHYHKESQIAAFRKHSIQSIELQHGIIAPQDIFYVLPQIVKSVQSKLLCADRILVYGRYWKSILEMGYEYKPEQIDIVGYYPFEGTGEISKRKLNIQKLIEGKVNVVVVTTQTYLDQYFINYVRWLQDQVDGSSTVILLKPHPAEDSSIYKKEFESSSVTFVVDETLVVLFSFASIHISIYSTTLYDALRYKVKNYCIYVEDYKDYIEAIVESGIAQLITSNQNPLSYADQSSKPAIDPNYYFENFDKFKLIKVA